MIKYVLRRIAGWILMIFLATNLTYFLASTFLQPRSNYLGRQPPVPEATVDALLDRYNLNDKVPIVQRWWGWLSDIVTQWNWGYSPEGVSVNEQISYRMWVSAELVLAATILSTVLGIGLGVYTAARQYKWQDRAAQQISIVTLNIPAPVMAAAVVTLAIAFNQAVGTTVFFVAGSSSIGVTGLWPQFVDTLQHLVLPTISLLVIGYAGYHFLQRSLLLDNINADYVRTARAKGLTLSQAIRKHALRTSIIPVATTVAFQIPSIFTGAVITETIFAWEGVGRYFTTTIAKNDIHGAVAIAAFGALLTAIGAILSDIVIAALDPRVRVS